MKKLKNVWLFLSFILMVAGMASCSIGRPDGCGSVERRHYRYVESDGE